MMLLTIWQINYFASQSESVLFLVERLYRDAEDAEVEIERLFADLMRIQVKHDADQCNSVR